MANYYIREHSFTSLTTDKRITFDVPRINSSVSRNIRLS